jgi:hypothetical protein
MRIPRRFLDVQSDTLGPLLPLGVRPVVSLLRGRRQLGKVLDERESGAKVDLDAFRKMTEHLVEEFGAVDVGVGWFADGLREEGRDEKRKYRRGRTYSSDLFAGVPCDKVEPYVVWRSDVYRGRSVRVING